MTPSWSNGPGLARFSPSDATSIAVLTVYSVLVSRGETTCQRISRLLSAILSRGHPSSSKNGTWATPFAATPAHFYPISRAETLRCRKETDNACDEAPQAVATRSPPCRYHDAASANWQPSACFVGIDERATLA